MATLFPTGPRRWYAPLASALLSLSASMPAPAAEHAAPPASAEPEAVRVAKAASAEDKGAAPAKPAAAAAATPKPEGGAGHPPPRPDPTQNPIDRLRERLAQKLGAAPAPDAEKGTNVLRVVSKVNPGAGFEHDLVTNPSAAHGVTMRRTIRSSHAPSSTPMSGSVPGQAHWDYVGENNPESWAQLKPEFSKCSTGKRQSPIDIRDGIHVDLAPVAVDYKPGGFRVLDNGHTVQVNVAPGNSIEVGSHRYDLIQFHFHRPSEERINGKQYDMVAHLVHRDLEGHLAVIAVLLDRGSALQAVQSVWNNLPLEKGDEAEAPSLLDPGDLLPIERSYYTYMGSLTTPPCSEGVLWMVMKKPVSISAEQIGIFARLYPMNARPIQASSGRLIKESN